jgi:hypothetical protein
MMRHGPGVAAYPWADNRHYTLEHGLGNALSEATNTHLRLLIRRVYGYHSADALIAMATLTRGGLCPPSPDDHESRPTEKAVGPRMFELALIDDHPGDRGPPVRVRQGHREPNAT